LITRTADDLLTLWAVCVALADELPSVDADAVADDEDAVEEAVFLAPALLSDFVDVDREAAWELDPDACQGNRIFPASPENSPQASMPSRAATTTTTTKGITRAATDMFPR
jgi:hypothetical protein